MILEEDTHRCCIERKEMRKLEVCETLERNYPRGWMEGDISRTISSLDLRLLSITALSWFFFKRASLWPMILLTWSELWVALFVITRTETYLGELACLFLYPHLAVIWFWCFSQNAILSRSSRLSELKILMLLILTLVALPPHFPCSCLASERCRESTAMPMLLDARSSICIKHANQSLAQQHTHSLYDVRHSLLKQKQSSQNIRSFITLRLTTWTKN